MPPVDTESGAPPRFLIVVAAAIALGLAVVVAIVGLTSPPEENAAAAAGPLPLVPVPAPQAASAPCATLLGAVPAALRSAGTELTRRELAAPAPPASAGWGEDDPVVLRCGLDRPPELTPTAQLRVINGVRWLQVPGAGTATWFVVDREVYAALTVPDTAGTGPLQQISDAIAAGLPPAPLRFG
ncbi:hypothetical protein CFN78_07275 [Amycolatopsis antarctica]|uniref:DUF3515 domain-containing protein n=1 Tax=Amycolatopsis antarctica TaxID=1854586 RepID=A0A263D6S7_9PSEU|nr:DUF3515 domain-containing protein [Amycolatopsis antarctica]OZM74071.1 hypothetical protein CFN78_07275 [Amycolatopsis antarctica]